MRKYLFITWFGILVTSLVMGNGNSETSVIKDSGQVTVSVIDAQAYALEEYQQLADGFKEANPGIDLEIQHCANDYEAVRTARINSGQIPDIMVGQSGSDVALIYDYAYDFTNDPVTENFTESALATSMNSDGKILSLPWVQENMSLIYNVDLFNKAGIEKLPTTIHELEAVCKQLKAAGITPFGVAFGETWVLSHIASHFIAAQGVDPKAIVGNVTGGKLTFANMKAYKNLFMMLDLMKTYGVEKPLEVGWEKSENMLSNGEVAMIHMGDWAEAVLKGFNADVNMAFLPMPVSDDPSDAAIMSYVSWQYVVNKDSKNLEATKKYLEYILTSDAGKQWMAEGIGSCSSSERGGKDFRYAIQQCSELHQQGAIEILESRSPGQMVLTTSRVRFSRNMRWEIPPAEDILDSLDR